MFWLRHLARATVLKPSEMFGECSTVNILVPFDMTQTPLIVLSLIARRHRSLNEAINGDEIPEVQ
jgi:hypothetical protein